MSRSAIKVLHLPTAVGGNSWGLAQGERRLGLEAQVLVTGDSWVNYPCDINLADGENRRVKRVAKELAAFFQIRNRYDVFHFNYGKSLIDIPTIGIHLLDLPFYPANKRLIFTYNGCDARQKYRTMARVDLSACHDDCCYNGVCNDKTKEDIKAGRVRKARKYAHHIFSLNPDLLWLLPEGATFLPYTVAEWYSIYKVPFNPGKKIKVVHSPTNRAAKGTQYIVQALQNLQRKYDIELILVENVPNSVALEIYKKADLVIDQVLIGWYGAFAVECMKMGKPVAVFIRDEDLRFIPREMARDLRDAVINIGPFNIEEALARYLENISLLFQKSEAAREYVHRWHDPVSIARITTAIYQQTTS